MWFINSAASWVPKNKIAWRDNVYFKAFQTLLIQMVAIIRCAHVIFSSLTVKRSHNIIGITAWRLSRQICHAAESCQFCRRCQLLTCHGWQLWPGHQLSSPQCFSCVAPEAPTKTFFCATAPGDFLILWIHQPPVTCVLSVGPVKEVSAGVRPIQPLRPFHETWRKFLVIVSFIWKALLVHHN